MNTFFNNKEDIIAWLDKYKVRNYTLVPDKDYGYMVDVSGRVILYSNKFEFIPIKFNKIYGLFTCANNKLSSLEFCPSWVEGDFYCSQNQLTSLKGCPQEVQGEFNCATNLLTSLEFCPLIINSGFYCGYNKLISLEYCPLKVEGDFDCYNNPDLGELQDIRDFSIIYQEHLKFKDKKDLAQKLDNELGNSTKTTRIKI